MMPTRAERAASIKAVRTTLLQEIAHRIAVESPDALHHDELACDLWKDEVDRTGQRLARIWGLEYDQLANV